MNDKHIADSIDIRSALRRILSRKWKDEYIYNYWLTMDEPEGYSVLPAVIGDDYFNRSSNPQRILFVGRSLNGWAKLSGVSKQSDLDAVLSAALDQENPIRSFLNSLITGYGFDKSGKKYSLKRSAFWRMVRMILNKNTKTAGKWDDNDWQKRIAWANVYCVAPQEARNPDWDLIAEGRANDYTELLKAEIDFLCPDVVILITATNKRKEQTEDTWLCEPFMSIFSIQVCNKDDIVGTSQYNNAQVFVVKRPEAKSYSSLQKTVDRIYRMIQT